MVSKCETDIHVIDKKYAICQKRKEFYVTESARKNMKIFEKKC